MDRKALCDISRKKRVFIYVEEIGNIAKACRVVNSKSCSQNPKLRLSKKIGGKILYLRKNYHFDPAQIVWSLERYFGMKVSTAVGYNVLLRNGSNKLPGGVRKCSVKDFKRYEKKVPGHRVQVDVKFLTFYKDSKKIRCFQYTAIDDVTRAQALKIYERHMQANGKISLIAYEIYFPHVFIQSRPTMVRNFKPNFIDIAKILVFATFISNQHNPISTAKLNDPTGLISRIFGSWSIR